MDGYGTRGKDRTSIVAVMHLHYKSLFAVCHSFCQFGLSTAPHGHCAVTVSQQRTEGQPMGSAATDFGAHVVFLGNSFVSCVLHGRACPAQLEAAGRLRAPLLPLRSSPHCALHPNAHRMDARSGNDACLLAGVELYLKNRRIARGLTRHHQPSASAKKKPLL
jgi:hypothetical protein